MKYDFKLSRLAKQDLEDIWIYSSKKWSVNQANKYYELIIQEIGPICEDPEIGKSIERLKKKHRSKPIKSHIIINKTVNKTVYVDRILHKRMDIISRLNE